MAQIILDSNNNLIQGDFDNATLNNRTKLQTTTTNATTNVYVVPNGSSTSAGVSVANNSNLTNASKIVMATNGSTDTQIISGVNGSGTYLPLSFYTNNALAMQVDTSNRVGIGTTDMASFASGKLVVASSGDNFVSLQAGTTNASGINMVDSATGSAVGLIRYQHASDAMDFFTNGSQRMIINSSGNVGIGNASPDTRLIVSANTGTAVQRIFNLVGTNTYQMSFHNSTQECGTITTGNNTVGYNSNSDYRLKDNVIPMTGALDKIAKLKPVTYTWKASGTNGQGFIAHELQEHFPDAVSGKKDAVDAEGKPIYQGVDTSFLVATLTKAIQEQQTIINELKTRIEALESK